MTEENAWMSLRPAPASPALIACEVEGEDAKAADRDPASGSFAAK